MVDYARFTIGGFFTIHAWTLLTFTIFVLVCIIKARLHVRKDNPVYALVTFNICCDIFQLFLHAAYSGPAIISGEWLFEGKESLGITIVGTCMLGMWTLVSLLQILFATNRLVVICFPRSIFFSMSRVIKCIILCCCVAFMIVAYVQLLSPCCRLIPDPRFFGYSYLPSPNRTQNISKYVNIFVDLCATFYGGFSYIALLVYVLKIGAPADRSGKREMRCFVQFLLMYLTYTLTWITFNLCPLLSKARETYVITPVVLTLNCGMNATIYLLINKEVRKAARQLIHKGKRLPPAQTITQQSMTSNRVKPTLSLHG